MPPAPFLAEREERVRLQPPTDRFAIRKGREEIPQPRLDQPQRLRRRQPLQMHLELGQSVPGRVLDHAALFPAHQAALNAGRHRQQVRRGVDQRFEEAAQRGELLVVEVVHLVEGQHERPAGGGRQPRQGDQHLLDLLGVGRRRAVARQPAQRQRRRRAVLPAPRRLVGRPIETKQDLKYLPIQQGRPRQVGGAQPVEALVVRPVQRLPRRPFAHAVHGPDQAQPDQLRQRRGVEAVGLAARQQVHHRAQQCPRQPIRGGLEIVQVDEMRPAVALRPAGQPRQDVTLADPGLAPQHGPDAATRRQRLPRQAGKPRERRVVDLGHVHVPRRRVVDAVVEEGIRRRNALEKVVEAGVRRGGSHEAFSAVGPQGGSLHDTAGPARVHGKSCPVCRDGRRRGRA